MLPLDEIHRFAQALDEANLLAFGGQRAEGLQILHDGLKQAQARQAAGDPQGEALVKQWQDACDIYLLSYLLSS